MRFAFIAAEKADEPLSLWCRPETRIIQRHLDWEGGQCRCLQVHYPGWVIEHSGFLYHVQPEAPW